MGEERECSSRYIICICEETISIHLERERERAWLAAGCARFFDLVVQVKGGGGRLSRASGVCVHVHIYRRNLVCASEKFFNSVFFSPFFFTNITQLGGAAVDLKWCLKGGGGGGEYLVKWWASIAATHTEREREKFNLVLLLENCKGPPYTLAQGGGGGSISISGILV